MTKAREPIFGLDVVRFVAACFVVAYHLAFKLFAVPGTTVAGVMPTGLLPAWWFFTWWGWIGVQIFFVISGAVIAYSMAGATPATFFRKRIERLYPALLICASIALPVQIAIFGTAPLAALTLYAKTLLFHPAGPWLLGQFWTLPMEAIFYGMMWLILLAGRVDALAKVAWAMAFASALFWIAETAGAPMPNGRLSCLLLLQHGCYFAIGIALAQPEMPSRRFLLPIAIATAAVQIRATAVGERLGHGVETAWPMAFLVWLVAIAAIAASIRYRSTIAERVAGSAERLRWLGLMTYPLYLSHMHIGLPVLLAALLAGTPVPLAIAGAIVASAGGAFGIARYCEPPVYRALSALLRGPVGRRLKLA